MRPGTLAWIAIAQGIGGATPALTKLALGGLGPFGLVVTRQILGTGFLLALAALGARTRGAPSPSPRPWTRSDWSLLLVLAWAGFALPQLLGALGLVLSTATHGALLSPLEPIGILLGAALVLREPIGLVHLLAGGLGLLGTAMIVLPTGLGAGVAGGVGGATGGPAAASLGGDLVMALGHLCWALYTLAAKPLVARHDPLRVAIRAGAISWLPLVPFAAVEPLAPARVLPALGWVLLLAFLSSGLGVVAWNRALREVSASTMAIFVFVQPAVGLAIGVAALGEPADAGSVLGAALIVLGVALATLRAERLARAVHTAPPPPGAD